MDSGPPMPGHLTRRGIRRSTVPTGHWTRLEPLAPHEHPPRPNRCWPPTPPLLLSRCAVERSTRGSRRPRRPPLTAGSPMSNAPIRNGSSGRCPRNSVPYATHRAAHPGAAAVATGVSGVAASRATSDGTGSAEGAGAAGCSVGNAAFGCCVGNAAAGGSAGAAVATAAGTPVWVGVVPADAVVSLLDGVELVCAPPELCTIPERGSASKRHPVRRSN